MFDIGWKLVLLQIQGEMAVPNLSDIGWSISAAVDKGLDVRSESI
jgi:hypothetical protein